MSISYSAGNENDRLGALARPLSESRSTVCTVTIGSTNEKNG
jgi:hypothetical protein